MKSRPTIYDTTFQVLEAKLDDYKAMINDNVEDIQFNKAKDSAIEAQIHTNSVILDRNVKKINATSSMVGEVVVKLEEVGTNVSNVVTKVEYHNERLNENEAKVAKVDAKLAMEAKVKLFVVKI